MKLLPYQRLHLARLLAKLAGGMAAPMQQMGGLFLKLFHKFAYALSLIEAGGGVPDDSSSEEAEATEEVEAEAEVAEEAEAEAEVAEEAEAEVVEEAEAEAEVAEEVEQMNEQNSENENEDKKDAGESR